jgi:hypothetical protein
MPLRHGLFRQQTGPLLVRMGIAGIYSRVQMQVFESPLNDQDSAAYAERAELAMHQRRHTQEVAYRLLESLHFLQHHIDCLEEHINTHEFPAPDQGSLSRRAGISADSVLQYLGMFLDAVGRTIPMVVLDDPKDHKIDSLNKAITAAEQQKAFVKVKQVCSELRLPDSWWRLGFQRTSGLRQRITHYSDLISFIGRGGNGRMNAVPYVHTAGHLSLMSDINFIESLSTILAGMCDWLDRLEAVLDEILVEREKRMGAQLVEFPVSKFLAPSVEFGELRSDRSDYLYLPICADPAAMMPNKN